MYRGNNMSNPIKEMADLMDPPDLDEAVKHFIKNWRSNFSGTNVKCVREINSQNRPGEPLKISIRIDAMVTESGEVLFL
jgi:hypothetical protein